MQRRWWDDHKYCHYWELSADCNYPRGVSLGAHAWRVTVLGLCVCLSVSPSVTALAASASANTCNQL